MQYRCEALVDQGKHIGEDPVGHACLKDAPIAVIDDRGMARWLCAECCSDLERHRDKPGGRCVLRPAAVSQEDVVRGTLAALVGETPTSAWEKR